MLRLSTGIRQYRAYFPCFFLVLEEVGEMRSFVVFEEKEYEKCGFYLDSTQKTKQRDPLYE